MQTHMLIRTQTHTHTYTQRQTKTQKQTRTRTTYTHTSEANNTWEYSGTGLVNNDIARSAVLCVASAARFWKHDISSASDQAFSGVLGQIFVALLTSKRCVLVPINWLTPCQLMSSQRCTALWRVYKHQVIYVLGHCGVDDPHTRTPEVYSIFCMFALHRHGHADGHGQVGCCQYKRVSEKDRNASFEKFHLNLVAWFCCKI